MVLEKLHYIKYSNTVSGCSGVLGHKEGWITDASWSLMNGRRGTLELASGLDFLALAKVEKVKDYTHNVAY